MLQILAAVLIVIAAPAATRTSVPVAYTCEVDGQSGRLEVQYETFDMSGQPADLPRDTLRDNIAAGAVKVFYKGTLHLDTQHYVLSGEDHIAEFTDVATHERFLMHLLRENQSLRMTRDPLGAGTPVYFCTDD